MPTRDGKDAGGGRCALSVYDVGSPLRKRLQRGASGPLASRADSSGSIEARAEENLGSEVDSTFALHLSKNDSSGTLRQAP